MKKFCRNCGHELESAAKFCGNCGVIQEENISEMTDKSVSTDEKVEEENTDFEESNKTTDQSVSQENMEIQQNRPELSNFITGKTPSPNKKRKFIIAGSIGGAVILLAGIYSYVQAQPQSIMSHVKIEFSGYNHQGVAQMTGDYQQEINSIISKKSSGLKTLSYEADTRVQLSQDKNLTNGEKVTLTVQTNLKGNPIKSESKTFTVSGLKKSTSYTAEDVLKSTVVTFKGFNHFGTINYDDGVFTTNDDISSLSNGDKVNLTLTDSYISQQEETGKVLEGTNTANITVEGLNDSPKISNLADFLKQEDAVVNNDHKDSTSQWFKEDYTVTRQDSYFIGEDVNASSLFSDSSGEGSFSILTIYKIDDKTDMDNTTNYQIYGYGGLQLSGDKINIASLTDGQKYSDYESFNTLDDALNSIKANYPSLVKVN